MGQMFWQIMTNDACHCHIYEFDEDNDDDDDYDDDVTILFCVSNELGSWV